MPDARCYRFIRDAIAAHNEQLQECDMMFSKSLMVTGSVFLIWTLPAFAHPRPTT